MSIEDFISGLDIETREDMIDENGNPEKHVEIHNDKLVCHPYVLETLKNGLRLLFNGKMEKEKENE